MQQAPGMIFKVTKSLVSDTLISCTIILDQLSLLDLIN